MKETIKQYINTQKHAMLSDKGARIAIESIHGGRKRMKKP